MTSSLIVLSATKFGDSSLVLHTISREWGKRSFMVRLGKKPRMALYLPLNIIEAEIVENPKSSLWTARKAIASEALTGIRNNIYKNTMTLFMSEVLFRTMKDGDGDDALFDWCRSSIMTLNALEADFSNFPIRFVLELTARLGFSPTLTDILPFAGDADVSANRVEILRTLLEAPFAEAMLIPLSGAERNAIAEGLLRYLEFHTESSINVRSLKVLRELYA